QGVGKPRAGTQTLPADLHGHEKRQHDGRGRIDFAHHAGRPVDISGGAHGARTNGDALFHVLVEDAAAEQPDPERIASGFRLLAIGANAIAVHSPDRGGHFTFERPGSGEPCTGIAQREDENRRAQKQNAAGEARAFLSSGWHLFLPLWFPGLGGRPSIPLACRTPSAESTSARRSRSRSQGKWTIFGSLVMALLCGGPASLTSRRARRGFTAIGAPYVSIPMCIAARRTGRA